MCRTILIFTATNKSQCILFTYQIVPSYIKRDTSYLLLERSKFSMYTIPIICIPTSILIYIIIKIFTGKQVMKCIKLRTVISIIRII